MSVVASDLDGTPGNGGEGYFVWRNSDDYTIEIRGQAENQSDPNHVAKYTVRTDGEFTNVDTDRFGPFDSISHADGEFTGQNEIGFGKDIVSFTVTVENASRIAFDLRFGETQYSIAEFSDFSDSEKQAVVESADVPHNANRVHLGQNETNPPSAVFEVLLGDLEFPPVQELPSDVEVNFNATQAREYCNYQGLNNLTYGARDCVTQPGGQTPPLYSSEITLTCDDVLSYDIDNESINFGETDLVTSWVGVDPATGCVWVGEEETGECARDCTTGRQPEAEPLTLPEIEDAADFVGEWLAPRSGASKEVIFAVAFVVIVAAFVTGTAEIAAGVVAIAVALDIITEEEAQEFL
jgi:hypothetical protein